MVEVLASVDINDKLLFYLRSELQNQRLTYSTPPTPMRGGYATTIYRFQLEEASHELAEPLVLKLYPAGSADRANLESQVQQAVASVGYPAPKVYLTCTDETVLGTCFLVMKLLPGRHMIDLPREEVPKMWAEAHLHLHNIDASALKDALESSGFNSEKRTFNALYREVMEGIEDRGYDWLQSGVNGLRGTTPRGQRGLWSATGIFIL